MMKFFGKKEKDAIVSIATGTMIPANKINDPVFAQEMMGQTIGFQLEVGEIVSPAKGIVEMIFPTGHAFAIRMSDGTGFLVHIGIDTVELNGKGFKVCVKQGQSVNAGQTIVKMDLSLVQSLGYDTTTMLIVSEPINKTIDYISFGKVKKGQVISK